MEEKVRPPTVLNTTAEVKSRPITYLHDTVDYWMS